MRAILIDPTERTITEVDYSGNLAELYKLLDCALVDNVPLGRGHDGRQEGMYVDDESLFELSNKSTAFRIDARATHKIVGKGLICSVDALGAAADTSFKIDGIKSRITWLGLSVVADVLAERLSKLRIIKALASTPQERELTEEIIAAVNHDLAAVRDRL